MLLHAFVRFDFLDGFLRKQLLGNFQLKTVCIKVMHICIYHIDPNFYNVEFHVSCCFALKVNSHDKIFVSLPKFHELLMPSTPTFSSTSHGLHE